MCVILAVDDNAKHPTYSELENAQLCNSDGVGAAWIQDDLVHFKKWTKLPAKEALNFPKPYVLHFRLATVGSSSAELCHPFLVTKKSPLITRGRSKLVLFHNGHWNGWQEWLAITYSGVGHIPKGPYSDTRAMAMIAAQYGPTVLEWDIFKHQKIATLSNSRELILYGSWDRDKEDGIYRSNTNHLVSSAIYSGYSGKVHTGKPCKVDTCTTYTYRESQLCTLHSNDSINWATKVCTHEHCSLTFSSTVDTDLCFNHRQLEKFNHRRLEKKAKPISRLIGCKICGAITNGGKEFCKDCVQANNNQCLECETPLYTDMNYILGLCLRCSRMQDIDAKDYKEVYKKWLRHKNLLSEQGFTAVPGCWDYITEKYLWNELNSEEQQIKE